MHRRSFLLGLGSLIAAPAVGCAALTPTLGVIVSVTPPEPFFSFSNDSDTGFYWLGGDIAVAVGGVTVATIDTLGA